MNADELRLRTKKLAIRTVELAEKMPNNYATQVIGKQLIRSATSVAANYRAVGRARSRADFINKMGIVLEEADETLFWLEMLSDLKKIQGDEFNSILIESKEIVAIFTAANKTARTNKK
jgi:four helix bundle protein